jgi:hypothetical protein
MKDIPSIVFGHTFNPPMYYVHVISVALTFRKNTMP